MGGFASNVFFIKFLLKITDVDDVKIRGIWMYANGVWFAFSKLLRTRSFSLSSLSSHPVRALLVLLVSDVSALGTH